MTEFIKYPKIFHLGTKKAEGFIAEDAMDNEIVVEEKMDGANFRFGVIDDRFRAGSRRVDFTPFMYPNDTAMPDGSPVIDTQKLGQFAKAVLLAYAAYSGKAKDGYIYFVEYMIPHTLEYDWERIPMFIGFDIYDTKAERFLDYDAKVEEFKRIEITPAPLVWRGKLRDFTVEEYENLIPQSAYRDGKAEGLVIKDYTRQWFVKIVAPEFREANLKVFGAGARKKAKKYSQSGAEWFVNAFITRRRIEKIIDRLIEEGKGADMSLMKWLSKEVLLDAWAEHYADAIFENVTIDMKELRSKTAKRCVEVLRRYLVRRALTKRG